MNKPEKLPGDESRDVRPVFVSYATADRKEALSVCKAIERRGVRCWISTRDVAPGENYQEEIVRAIRDARAMVLVFSEAANNSDEIKKELSLASRFHVPVMALRIEDVEPSDAFAYELSTRQWIDAFESWDKSIDALVARIEQISASPGVSQSADSPGSHRSRETPVIPKRAIGIAAAAISVALLLGSYGLFRQFDRHLQRVEVRIGTFNAAGADGSVSPQALRAEMLAAFSSDNVLDIVDGGRAANNHLRVFELDGSISTAAAQARFVPTLIDAATGEQLWSHAFSEPLGDAALVPRRLAAQTSQIVRCAVSGTTEQGLRIPDRATALYAAFCEEVWSENVDIDRAIDDARKVTQLAPDLSRGWSGLAIYAEGASRDRSRPDWPELHEEAISAATRAARLDPRNSEAYEALAALTSAKQFAAREALHEKSIAAEHSDCGCEYQAYAKFLASVGRLREAGLAAKRAHDTEPVDLVSSWRLADLLSMQGKMAEASAILQESRTLWPKADLLSELDVRLAFADGADGAAVARQAPGLSDVDRAIALETFNAMQSRDEGARAAAVQDIVSRSASDGISRIAVDALGALGASGQALAAAASLDSATMLLALFDPTLDAARHTRAFAALAQRIGLVEYWRASHKRPDLCSNPNAAPVCRMI